MLEGNSGKESPEGQKSSHFDKGQIEDYGMRKTLKAAANKILTL